MDPTVPLDSDAVQTWLGRFFDVTVHDLVSPGALLVVGLLILGVALLALIVADMSVPETGVPASESPLAGWFGQSCAWLCPWRPTPQPGRPRRTHGRYPAASSHVPHAA